MERGLLPTLLVGCAVRRLNQSTILALHTGAGAALYVVQNMHCPRSYLRAKGFIRLSELDEW